MVQFWCAGVYVLGMFCMVPTYIYPTTHTPKAATNVFADSLMVLTFILHFNVYSEYVSTVCSMADRLQSR